MGRSRSIGSVYEEDDRAIVVSASAGVCKLAAGPIETVIIAHSTSDSTGNDSRPMRCGLLPPQQWCLCPSSGENARLSCPARRDGTVPGRELFVQSAQAWDVFASWRGCELYKSVNAHGWRRTGKFFAGKLVTGIIDILAASAGLCWSQRNGWAGSIQSFFYV